MAKSKRKNTGLSNPDTIVLNKISVYFKKPILKQILRILVMPASTYRTFKIVKNINRLFTYIDMEKYKNKPDSEAIIWCIQYVSKQWLDGVMTIDLIIEMARRSDEIDTIKENILLELSQDETGMNPNEVKELMQLVAEALQYGFVMGLKDEYIDLLDDVSLDNPGSFRELTNRLFLVSQSLLDIKHNTNMVTNKIEFNSGDLGSIKSAIDTTIRSLKESGSIYKTGIRRLNTLLSPGYMNGRVYTYLGLPGGGKSLMLLKTALDVRRYNPNVKPKTPGMKPAVLYITMENSFTETIERIWNMTFDEPMVNYEEEQAVEMLCKELGIWKMVGEGHDDVVSTSLADMLEEHDKEENELNIEIVVQYYPYRSISTDDLYTIINDLRDENLEVCILVFDYVKRIRPATPVKDGIVKMELNRVINELKALSVLQDIPVVTAHQMNRAAAATVDAAVKQGKGDVNKLVGRENVGDAYELIESSDWAAVVNIEYKPQTDDRYMTINVVKRRRIDAADSSMAKYTYLAHPFAKNNGLRLLNDLGTDKVLSLQSLSSDIDMIGAAKEITNAIPRLRIEPTEFQE